MPRILCYAYTVVRHIYTMKYHSAIKRKEIGSFVASWMDLESVIQNKGSQKEKNKYHILTHIYQFISVQLLSHVWLFVTPWTAAHQASLSITNSQSSLKLMSIESVMPSNHLILCRSLLLPSIFPSIRVFSNESILRIKWPKYWSFSFSISPSNEYSGLISLMIDWFERIYIWNLEKWCR